VADTGGGIPQEQINRIFEPFYTTKKKGTASG
jgi:signal transduction histidine kinase